MRITSGRFKSRIIKAPREIRPTLDNVRKAIFDIIGEGVKGATVLDLYAGSGALGLEALSRGAASCVFVDNSRASIRAIKENLVNLGLAEAGFIEVIYSDSSALITALLEKGATFDLVFLDPPYYKSLAKKSLFLLGDCDILTKIGAVIVEHSKHDEMPTSSGLLKRFRTARYGDTQVSFYLKRD